MAETVLILGTPSTARVRHPLAAFGLVFLTLGIYYFVWYYKINRELRDLGRVDPVRPERAQPRLARKCLSRAGRRRARIAEAISATRRA
jgi:Domain of unknown function (DUF4234)